MLATWSGQALAALKWLTELLGAEYLDVSVPVLVCDADDLPAQVSAGLGAPSRGLGESLWVKVSVLLDHRSTSWREEARRNASLLGC